MNKIVLNAAVKKYSKFASEPEDEVRAKLAADEKSYTQPEIDEIYQFILASKEEKKEVKKDFNGGLMDGIEYSDLEAVEETDEDGDINLKSSEAWKKYNGIVESLLLDEQKDFVQFFASGMFRITKKGDHKLVGVKINRSQPINVTRIPVKIAIELNRQIENRDNPASNSRYYLLKK